MNELNTHYRLLLGLDSNWESVQTILERGVKRGLGRRGVNQVDHVGLDEERFQRGPSYVSVMVVLIFLRIFHA